jgi:hypothetical protein
MDSDNKGIAIMRPEIGSHWKDVHGRTYRVEGILDESGEAYVRPVRATGAIIPLTDFGDRLVEEK